MGVIRKAIQPQFQRGKWKILRGDLVHITAGKDKGQQGVVSKVIRDDRVPRVIVEGRNLVRRSACFKPAPDGATTFVQPVKHASAPSVAQSHATLWSTPILVTCRQSDTSSARGTTQAGLSQRSRPCTILTCSSWTQ